LRVDFIPIALGDTFWVSLLLFLFPPEKLDSLRFVSPSFADFPIFLGRLSLTDVKEAVSPARGEPLRLFFSSAQFFLPASWSVFEFAPFATLKAGYFSASDASACGLTLGRPRVFSSSFGKNP